MSILPKLFTSQPFLLRRILKPSNVINQISPNLFQNLRESSKQFIKGVINKDTEYISQVTANSLSSRLVSELVQNKQIDFIKQYKLENYQIDVAENFQIAPYVIFGEDFKNRMQRLKLYEDIKPISSNRFIKFLPNTSILERFRQYGKKQIFGFNCIYQPLMVNVSNEQRINLRKQFMVSFQTDSQNIDPFIVDCQGALFEDWRAQGFK